MRVFFHKQWVVFSLACCALHFCSIVHAGATTATSNMNPFTLIYADMTPLLHGNAVNNDSFSVDVTLELANHSIEAQRGSEHIVFDGETYKTTLWFRYAIAAHIALDVSVPFVYHTGGLLDNAIEQWHDFTGLSNTRRADYPSNHLLFQYLENGETQFRLDQSTGGVGDARLEAIFTPWTGLHHGTYFSLKLGVKLPTGDAAKLTGSGASDWMLSAHVAHEIPLAGKRLAVNGGLGIHYLGEGNVISQRQVSDHTAVYAAIAWPWTGKLKLLAQLQIQEAYYQSQLQQLGDVSTVLYVGAALTSKHGAVYRFALGENLVTDATPDFLLYFSTSMH